MWNTVSRFIAGTRPAAGNTTKYRKLSNHDLTEDSSSINDDSTPSGEQPPQKLDTVAFSPVLMPPVPNFESKIYTCDRCQEARRDPLYPTRLAMLLQPMYCSECGSDHAAIFFSHKQRNVDAQFRKCICHEGYRSICPHIRIYLSDIKERQGTTIVCNSQCAWHVTTVKFFDGKMEFQSSAFSDRINLDLLSDDTQVPLGLRLLRAMHSVESPAFCPHRRASTDPFSDERWQSSKPPSQPEAFPSLVCNAGCFDWVSYCPTDEPGECANATGGVHGSDQGPIHHHLWHRSLEPDSFGLFSDLQSKNIVWCDDKKCSTSLGLARFETVKEIALLEERKGYQWSMKAMPTYWRLADQSTLQQLTNTY